jgi:hypothetical protein
MSAVQFPLSRLRERVRVRASLLGISGPAPAAPTPHPSLFPQGEKGCVTRVWKNNSRHVHGACEA